MLLYNSHCSPHSLGQVQSDIDHISSWISARLLAINIRKSKYMIVSRKSASFVDSLPSLFLNDCPLDRVSSYRYLGVILTSNLSWTPHIKAICSKARQQIGLIYRSFYVYSSSKSLLQLYLSFVLPTLCYCSSVWDPPCSSVNALLLERVQSFGLRVCSKEWSASSASLLHCFQLPSLSTRRLRLKLLLDFKFLNQYTYLPPDMFLPAPVPLQIFPPF